ncbi:MAG: hypothetical protein SGJ11_04560 [Phycisphaerae bacterium]|nr:hypothetical protein [Phycisphaerae bacterium]
MFVRVRRLLLFVAIGLLASLTIAWVCALAPHPNATLWINSDYFDFGNKTTPIPSQLTDVQARHVPPRLAGAMRAYSGTLGFGLQQYSIRSVESNLNHMQTTGVTAGWPLPCLWGHISYDINETPQTYVEWRGGIMESRSAWIPLYPMWFGLAADSLLYGGSVALVWIGVGTVRRQRRARAGKCLSCGHLLAGVVTCPECGRPSAEVSRPCKPWRGKPWRLVLGIVAILILQLAVVVSVSMGIHDFLRLSPLLAALVLQLPIVAIVVAVVVGRPQRRKAQIS